MKEGRILICNRDSTAIEGKTIDKCRVAISHNTDHNQIILTFTDGSYCVLHIDVDENTGGSNFIDAFCCEMSSYRTPPHFFNHEGKVVFEKFIRDQIELGIIDPMPQEDLQKIIDDRKEKIRASEYERYLELKAKFENE